MSAGPARFFRRRDSDKKSEAYFSDKVSPMASSSAGASSSIRASPMRGSPSSYSIRSASRSRTNLRGSFQRLPLRPSPTHWRKPTVVARMRTSPRDGTSTMGSRRILEMSHPPLFLDGSRAANFGTLCRVSSRAASETMDSVFASPDVQK